MEETISRKNLLTMKLLHYFIIEMNYNPIILQGADDEIWLENFDSEYKIIRIVSNTIINDEQLKFDIHKTKHIMRKIKAKTFSWSMNALTIFTDIDNKVKLDNTKNIDFVAMKNEEDLDKYKFVNDTFPGISKKLIFREEGVNLFMKITSDINKKNKKDVEKVDEIFKPKTPIITYFLISVNVLIAIYMYILGNADSLIQELALSKPHVVSNNEFYRIFTSAFLHGSISHILINMYSLYIIGTQIEGFMGRGKYLIIYFFSILMGSLFSLVLNDNVVSVGASGAIFGLLGSLLYFGYHYRVYLGNVLKSQIIPIILINLAIGFMIPGIDNFAHIGGLVGGVLITLSLGVKYKSTQFDQINGWIVSILLTVFLFLTVLGIINLD